MESTSLKERLQTDMKQSMREGKKERLGVIRFLMAAIKQKEIDERPKYGETGLPDEDVIAVIEKLCKQRRDSIDSYQQAGRADLVNAETNELHILLEFLPPQLSDTEVADMIKQAIKSTGASDMKDMGRVMTEVKPKLQGRADMKAVSAMIKNQLTGK